MFLFFSLPRRPLTLKKGEDAIVPDLLSFLVLLLNGSLYCYQLVPGGRDGRDVTRPRLGNSDGIARASTEHELDASRSELRFRDARVHAVQSFVRDPSFFRLRCVDGEVGGLGV